MQETQAQVCQRVGCGVTLTNPRAKFCGHACRQAAMPAVKRHTARRQRTPHGWQHSAPRANYGAKPITNLSTAQAR